MTCAELQQLVTAFSLVKNCDTVDGMLRISLPFQYPNGSNVDVFVKNGDGQSITISDMGMTVLYLLDLHIKPWTTKKRKQVVAHVCRSLGVVQVDGEFQVSLPLKQVQGQIVDSMVRLAQACIRVSDLSFSTRFTRAAGEFRDNFEEFIESSEIPCEPDVPLLGRFGDSVNVDYRINGKSTVSLVKTLSSNYPSAAHNLVNEVFRSWFDLEPYGRDNQFITIFDDTRPAIFRESDLSRLRTMSQVMAFPSQSDELRLALAA